MQTASSGIEELEQQEATGVMAPLGQGHIGQEAHRAPLPADEGWSRALRIPVCGAEVARGHPGGPRQCQGGAAVAPCWPGTSFVPGTV